MRNGLLVLALLAVGRPALAQCPDGSMPNPDGSCGRRPPPPAATAIAVLDFQNLSPRDTLAAAQAAEFIDALTERLQLVERLQVASRAAVRALGPRAATMRPAALGSALHVQYLVTGTVRRVPGRIRITVELVRASTGRAVWSQQLERSDVDLPTEFAIELAGAVLGTLRPREQAALAPASDSIAFVARTWAILPFSFPAGDTALQRVADRVTDVVTQRLQDGNLPSAADPAEVRAAWLRFGGADTLMDAVAQAYRVGRFTRAPYVLRGEVRREGSRVRLGATLYGAQTRSRLVQRSVVTTFDSAETAAQVLALQVMSQQAEGPEHRMEWLARRDPLVVRLYMGPPAGTDVNSRAYLRGVLERDSLMVYPVLRPWFVVPYQFIPVQPWRDSVVAIAFQRRHALPREDRYFTEALVGPWFGLADDAEARIALWQRAADEAPTWYRPWEHLAYALTTWGPLTSIPDWRNRANAALARALVLHDSCRSMIPMAFQFALWQGDTARARNLAAVAERRGYRSPTGLEMLHLAAMRGDLADSLYWVERPLSLRYLMALARSQPAAVPAADAAVRAWERTEAARRPNWLAWWVGGYSRDRGQRERWLRFDALNHQVRIEQISAQFNPVIVDAERAMEVLYYDAPEDAAVERVVARLTRIASGDSTPAPSAGVVAIARCQLAQWRLARGDTSGVTRAIAYLREMDARDRAGLQDGLPNAQRWSVCPAVLDAQLARLTGREPLAKARALDALLRRGPLPRRGLDDMQGAAELEGLLLVPNLLAARLLAAAGDTAGALVAVRRRAQASGWWELVSDNLIDFLREEGRYAAAMADTLGALEAYDHYLGLRRERPDYEPWGVEWDSVRAEVAALRRRP